MSVIYHSTAALARVLVKILSNTTVLDGERIPTQGSIIIVCNHNNYLDPVIVVVSVRRYLSFMAKEELFRVPLLGGFFISTGVIPTKRHSADRAALRRAEAVLSSGGAICMFPEGTRSKDGRLLPGQPGATFLALHSGVPVIPVGITGTQRVHSPLDVLKRPEIVVNVGEPFSIKKESGASMGEALQSDTERIMVAIARLLPRELRGAYESTVT